MSDEVAVRFDCAGACLYGVVHRAGRSAPLGVLVVVGGPQYRVGSHRQFVLLARDLAAAGIPVMRFDYRGMGDGEEESGRPEPCECVEEDLRCAIDVFFEQAPGLEQVVLWGLCDGAAAISLYAHADRRVKGIVLLNPWLGTRREAAKARLKYYYLDRLRNPELWSKIRSGEFSPKASGVSLLYFVIEAMGLGRAGRGAPTTASRTAAVPPLADRVAEGLERLRGPVLLVLSGKDEVAAEFRTLAEGAKRWRRLLRARRITQHILPDADHTFSRRCWRDQVTAWTREWLESI